MTAAPGEAHRAITRAVTGVWASAFGKGPRILAPDLEQVVADITGRAVQSFDSQIVFAPTRTFELFVLAP